MAAAACAAANRSGKQYSVGPVAPKPRNSAGSAAAGASADGEENTEKGFGFLKNKSAWKHVAGKSDEAPPPKEKHTIMDSLFQHGIFSQSVCQAVIDTKLFGAVMNLVIVTNTITVGVDQQYKVRGETNHALAVCEDIFITIFILELMFRFRAGGLMVLRDNWVLFDSVLVAVGVFATWMVPFLENFVDVGQLSNVGVGLVLRTARLARLARALRLAKSCEELWMLINAFLSSAYMMCYVIIVLCIVLYMFSTTAIEVITLRYQNQEVPEEISALVAEWFPNLGTTMLTLVQFVCFDSVGAIYRPFILYEGAMAIYFVAVMLVVGIVLMNIITAVIVNSALDRSQEDREIRRRQQRARQEELLTRLYDMFVRLDKDGSGNLELNEILSIGHMDADMLAEFSGEMNPIDLFHMLDLDNTGLLSIDEFCDGLHSTVIGQTPLELRRMAKQCAKIEHVLRAVESLHTFVTPTLNCAVDRLEVIEQHLREDKPASRWSQQAVFHDVKVPWLEQGELLEQPSLSSRRPAGEQPEKGALGEQKLSCAFPEQAMKRAAPAAWQVDEDAPSVRAISPSMRAGPAHPPAQPADPGSEERVIVDSAEAKALAEITTPVLIGTADKRTDKLVDDSAYALQTCIMEEIKKIDQKCSEDLVSRCTMRSALQLLQHAHGSLTELNSLCQNARCVYPANISSASQNCGILSQCSGGGCSQWSTRLSVARV